jgi:3-methylfumaryl-CoA hydratase
VSVPAEALEHWKQWIGRIETRSETLDPESLRRFAAAIGEDLEVERVQPSLAHWAFFLPVAPAGELGEDGHPKRGGFLPPVTLPRRMFASSQMRFASPLVLGEVAERKSVVADVAQKSGRTGDLVLVQVEHSIVQAGEAKVQERQTIVYRDAGNRVPPITAVEQATEAGDEVWQPRAVDLFRFSAVTFNSHRIHYDLPYATAEEGYPDLVVHGPFTAVKLFGRARQKGAPATFSFRAVAPIFLGQPVVLRADGGGSVRAIRADGADAMIATADY